MLEIVNNKVRSVIASLNEQPFINNTDLSLSHYDTMSLTLNQTPPPTTCSRQLSYFYPQVP